MQTTNSKPRSFFQTRRYERIRRITLIALSVVLCAVLLAWPWITDFYSYNASYYDGLVASAAIAAILTISLNLCMGFTGLLSLMHTGLQLLGGYAVATIVVKAGLHWTIGIGVAVLVGAIFSVLVISISLRATYLYFGMITLAADLVLVEAGRSWDSLTGGVVGISGVYATIGGEIISKTTFYYIALAALVLVYIVQRNLVKSGVGRAAMAVRESADTASAMGIWTARTKVTIFAISGGIGGLAGSLYSLQLGFVNPDIGLLENGLELVMDAWNDTPADWNWSSMDRYITHQVSQMHTNAIIDSAGIDRTKIPTTFPHLGNIGPAALPITLARELDSLKVGDRILTMGVGSGLNVAMLEIEW